MPPRPRRITVIGRDGKKTRVEEKKHLKDLYIEREFGNLSRFEEPSISNYSNESNGWYHDAKVERGESTNSEGSYTNSQRSNSEGSFNNQISKSESSNIVSPTPSFSISPNKPKTKNKGKGSRKSKKNKSRRKGNRKSKKNKSRKEANKKRNAERRSQRNAKATRNKFNSPN